MTAKASCGDKTHHDKRDTTTLHKERTKVNNIAWQQHMKTQHGSNHDHPFTYSASHKDMAVGTQNLKFGLISSKSTVHCVCLVLFMSF